MMKKKRLGIYGGAFNPPHNGHVRAAELFVSQMKLDKLLIVPTLISPHKENLSSVTPTERLKMCELAFSHINCAELSDIEIKRGGKSYTYLTLEELRRDDTELYMLCGTDMFLTLDEWKNPEKIFALATVCYIRRETDSDLSAKIEKRIAFYREKYGARIEKISAPVTKISSSEIRRSIGNGADVSEHVTKSVLDYIRDNGLYRELDVGYLRNYARSRLSEDRYIHTLGVESMAARIGELVLPERIEELRCAALLHDIAKELPVDEQISLARSSYNVTDDDLLSPKIIHSFAAPGVIMRDLPRFSTTGILSATFNHTVGDENMSLFDEIIFISDFIEENRVYDSSKRVRADLLGRLDEAKTQQERICALHLAVVDIIDCTVSHLKSNGSNINKKMMKTREAFTKRI